MQKISTFFKTFINSLTKPAYYADVLAARAWFSWKYFLFWNLLISSVVLFYVVPPLLQFEPEVVSNEAISLYPQDLEIYGDADGIKINQERPYSVSFPEKWTTNIPGQGKMDVAINDVPLDTAEELRLVTFDLDENIQNIQDFYDSHSLALLTESTIYVLDDTDTGEVRVYAMPSFENEFSFSYADLTGFEQKMLNHPFVAQKWYVPLISLFILLFMLPLTIWWRVLTIAVYSVVVWIAAGFFMKSLKLSYAKAFQVGLHSLTLPVLLKIVSSLLVQYSSVDFEFGGIWFFAVYLIWTLFVLHQVRELSPSSRTRKTVVKASRKKAPKKTAKKKSKK